MMKNLLCAALALAMMLSFAACGSTTADVDIAAVKTEIIETVPVTDPIEISTDKLMSLYGIAAEDVSENASFLVMSDIFPAEIIMIKAVDTDAAATVAAALQTRLDSLKVQSQSYDAESYAIAQACTVMTDGTYVAMFFSEHGAQMEEIYNSYF